MLLLTKIVNSCTVGMVTGIIRTRKVFQRALMSVATLEGFPVIWTGNILILTKVN